MDINLKFDSCAAFANYVGELKTRKGLALNKCHSLDTCDFYQKWTGSNSFKDSMDYLKFGWHEGAEKARAFMSEGGNFDVVSEPEIIQGVVGFCPCVPAYLAGVPQNMLQFEAQPIEHKIITIVYNTAVAGCISSDDVMKYASRLFNVIIGLEAQGVGVQLYASANWHVKHTEQLNLLIKIKDSGESLNILRAVFPIVNTSFCRRLVFRVMECEKFRLQGWHKHYGTILSNPEEKKEAISKMGVNTPNIFDFYTLRNKTEQQIADMIK